MATKIITKNSSTTTAIPTAGDLVQGELAVNVTDKRLFTEDSGGAIVELGTSPSTIDINAGTIDGTTIGGTTAAAGSFTTGQFGTSLNVDGIVTTDGLTIDDDAASTTTLGRYSSGYAFSLVRPSATAAGIEIRTNAGNPLAHFLNDGTTKLHHNGSAKLTTLSTGIDITGTVTADGLTVDGDVTLERSGVQTRGIKWNRSGTIDAAINLYADEIVKFDNFYNGRYQFRSGASGAEVLRLDIATGGNVSFYEDTGTTAKFSWSSANETISIGTGASSTATISAYSRTVSAGLPSALRIIENTGASTFWDIGSDGGASPNLKFYANANTTPRMTLSSTGAATFLAGITATTGTFSSSVALNTASTAATIVMARSTTGNNNMTKYSTGGTDEWIVGQRNDGTSNFRFYNYATASDVVSIDATTGAATFSGNVQVNGVISTDLQSPSAWTTNTRAVQITTYGAVSSNDNLGNVSLTSNAYESGDGTWSRVAGTSAGRYMIDYQGANTWSSAIAGASDSAITWVDRMKLDASGNLLVGTSSFGSNVGVQARGSAGGATDEPLATSVGSTGSIVQIGFFNPNGRVGYVATNGTSTSYSTSSDYRLKEDAVPMTGATERVKALRPINFAWKADGSRTDGFLAHEAQEVVPEAVHGTKDAMRDEEYEVTPAVEEVRDEDGNVTTEAVAAVMGTRSVPDYQGIDQSKLVPLLTATIQELIARIEALEGA